MRTVNQASCLIMAATLSFSSIAQWVVEDGYVRKPIPGRSMTAAFMTVRNTGSEDIILTSATLEGAKSVEIHSHSHVDGMMRMRQIHELTIKVGESVSLAPGGLHLMVFGITSLPEQPELTLCDKTQQCLSHKIETQSLIRK